MGTFRLNSIDSPSDREFTVSLEALMPPQRRCILGAATLKTVCKVAVLGFGTVGRSVSRILARRAPGNLRLTYVCNRTVARKKVDWLPPEVQWTEDFSRVLSSDVDVVV